MNFLDQLKLQALRRYEEESRAYSTGLNDQALALEAMVANSMDGIVLVEAEDRSDPHLRVQYANPTFIAMSGYPAEEIIGKPFSLIFSPETVDLARERVVQCFAEGRLNQLETLCVRRDGTQFLAAIRLIPVLGEHGKAARWFFELRDVTDQREESDRAEHLSQLQSENKRLEAALHEARALQTKLKYDAIHDPVTAAVSRPYLMQRLQESLSRAQTDSRCSGSVLCVGFENFEKLAAGMESGAADCILLELAHRIRREIPWASAIARPESVEFAAILEGVDMMTAFDIANTLIKTLSQAMEIFGRSIEMLPSVGLCTIGPRHDSPEQILRDSETAMDRARRQGGLRALWYEEATNVRTMALSRTKFELEDALGKDQIEVYYQPQLDVQTTPPRLCAAEALVRWNHPKHGLLTPDRFLPTAERSGLIVPLGLRVIKTACRQMKLWQSNVLSPDISLILNLSASQLAHPSFFSDFVDILAETEIDAHVLELDVPETAFKQADGPAADVLHKLRQLGIKIVLDNWGKAGTSIVQLDSYPVNAVKLDRSLVNSLAQSASRIELARLMVSYARSLGMAPSAQGVSTPFESQTLQSCGCSVHQGFLYSGPVTAKEISNLLDRGTRVLLHA